MISTTDKSDNKNKYFLNSKVALKIAKQQNRKLHSNYTINALQICYYNGKRLKNAPLNCICLPFDKLAKYLAKTKNTYPNVIDYTNSKYIDIEAQDKFFNIFKIEFNKSFDIKIPKQNDLKQKIKNTKINFNDKEFRIFISNNKELTSIPSILENISKSFQNKNFKVKYYTAKNDMQTYHKLPLYKAIYKFNPHIVISINNEIDNSIFSKNVFNFIFIQDFIPLLTNNDTLKLRKRDFVFSLQPYFDKYLDEKQISYHRQSWCIRDNIFRIYKSIKRENKIVFIGDSYSKMMQYNNEFSEIIEFCIKIMMSEEYFTISLLDEIILKFKLDKYTVLTKILPFIINDLSVILLCQVKTNLTIEIYGEHWEQYEKVLPYYKGNITSNKDRAKLYNSAKFVLAPSLYISEQRVYEAILCNAMPVVYNIKYLTSKEDFYDKSLLYFKGFSDLERILNGDLEIKFFNKINKNISSEYFVNILSALIKKTIKNK